MMIMMMFRMMMEFRGNRLCFMHLIILFVLLFTVSSAFFIDKRNLHLDDEDLVHEVTSHLDSNSTEGPCHLSVTCAWEVYTPFKRTFEYLIKNTCECPSGYVCVKVGEDLSISAYIYKCRLNISSVEEDDDELDSEEAKAP